MGGNRWGAVLSLAGVVLVIIGILWLNLIFPALAKMPTDYARTYYFEGSFSVLNAATQSMDTFPIQQALAQEATGTQNGALLIHEKRTVKNAVTGDDLSAYYGDESTLAVDRKTLKFVKELDERERYGYWAPPRGLGEGDSFEIWNPSVNKPLTASYVRSQEFQGLKVVVFRIEASDVSVGTHPQTQLPLLVSTTVNLLIEPKSGTVVDQTAITKVSMDMGVQKVPVQIANVKWTRGTINEMVDVAKSADTKLLWFETIIPWLLVGLGAVLLIIGVVFMVRKRATPA